MLLLTRILLTRRLPAWSCLRSPPTLTKLSRFIAQKPVMASPSTSPLLCWLHPSSSMALLPPCFSSDRSSGMDRIFYWFGARYSLSLLAQALLMIVVQSILLKVSLDNRPPPGARGGLQHAPFSAHNEEGLLQQLLAGKRPYQFWQWPSKRP